MVPNKNPVQPRELNRHGIRGFTSTTALQLPIEWAYSWARRTVIQQAIRMMEPAQKRLAPANTELVGLEIEPRLGSILKLDVLERFVFVMSVLEGYSSQDCSILLGCSRKVIVDARARALEQLANAAEIIAVQGDELQDIYSLASVL
jgi:DNA-directed RNA polymerase specialized sigma24 family protein